MKKILLLIVTIAAYFTASAQWVNYGNIQHAFSIHFPTENIGYAIGDGVYKTSDSGTNWTLLDSITYNPDSFTTLYFTSNNVGFLAGDYGLKKTINGGKSCYLVLNADIKSIFFTSVDTGYAVGDGVYKTTDAGQTWTLKNSSTRYGFTSVYFSDKKNGCVVGHDTIVITHDGGDTWLKHASKDGFTSVSFPVKDIGYAVSGGYGIIKKTLDGGITWQKQNSGTSVKLFSIFFTSKDTGYAGGGDGIVNCGCGADSTSSIILKTTDGGNTWLRQPSPWEADKVMSFFFTDHNTGYAGCLGGVLKTINGGVTGINRLTKDINFSIYPNPAGSFLQITGLSSDTYTIEITNSLGERVLQTTSETGNIDISVLADGIYYAKVYTTKGECTVIKFIKN